MAALTGHGQLAENCDHLELSAGQRTIAQDRRDVSSIKRYSELVFQLPHFQTRIDDDHMN